MPVNIDGGITLRGPSTGRGWHEPAGPALSAVIRGGKTGKQHPIRHQTRSAGIWLHMKPRRVIVGDYDVVPPGRGGNFALRGPDKRPEAAEDLDHVAGWIIHLSVAAA